MGLKEDQKHPENGKTKCSRLVLPDSSALPNSRVHELSTRRGALRSARYVLGKKLFLLKVL